MPRIRGLQIHFRILFFNHVANYEFTIDDGDRLIIELRDALARGKA
jgi:hypothetical protein